MEYLERLTDLFQRGGSYAAVALLVLYSWYLQRGWRKCQDRAVTDRERLITVIAAQAETNRELNAALVSIRMTLDGRGQAIGDLSHQVEMLQTKMLHGIGNNSASLDGLARLIAGAPLGPGLVRQLPSRFSQDFDDGEGDSPADGGGGDS